jgi:protein gp37
MSDRDPREIRSAAQRWVMMDRSGRTLEQTGSTGNMGPITHVARVGKKAAGRVLDGRTWDEVPA